jgi:KDO2-lipid IV(A) lauroyltransferase
MSEPSLRRKAAYLVQAAAFAGFLIVCRVLPVDWASALGGAIGRALGPILGQSRIARRNLARAMPQNDAAANREIIRGMWDNLGRVVAEYPHLPRICDRLRGGRVEVAGLEHIDALLKDSRPAILFGGHIANWEVLAYIARHTGLDLAFIYRTPNNLFVDRMLRRLRDAPNQFRKGAEGARQLYAHLRRGGHAAMLIDQKMNDGIPVPFFGRDAMTAPAIAQLALRLECTLLPARTERLGGARFRITVYPPIAIARSGDRAADERLLMARINALVEGWIAERPAQWLWLHRRWPD